MKIRFNNKKAFHNFFVSDLVEAGIELQGFEVKSIREGAVNLSDSYVKIVGGEAWLKNCYIAPYDKNGLTSSYDSRRTRKLLLHKGEILRLERMVNEKGLSIAGLYFPKNAFFFNPDELKLNLAPYELIPCFLGLYSTVEEVKKKIFNLMQPINQ